LNLVCVYGLAFFEFPACSTSHVAPPFRGLARSSPAVHDLPRRSPAWYVTSPAVRGLSCRSSVTCGLLQPFVTSMTFMIFHITLSLGTSLFRLSRRFEHGTALLPSPIVPHVAPLPSVEFSSLQMFGKSILLPFMTSHVALTPATSLLTPPVVFQVAF
jgi:hypothetical protein